VSTSNSSPVPANLEQQRKLAKDLIRAARGGDPSALARIRAVRADAGAVPGSLKLAVAQLAVAREGGFDSWPALVAGFQERDVKTFREAVEDGDVHRVRQLLALPHVRTRINDPMFAFGQRPAHISGKNEAMLTALIAAGADVNLKSDWENGPYTVLDNANEETARFLLARGATLTANVAARLGWMNELRRLVDADRTLVHARGGDGQQPLHQAATVAIADFLLDHGAVIDERCIDHQTTPAQYALVDRPDVCRRLLERGAVPDIFMAARLGDIRLAARLLETDPNCAAARTNAPGYALVPPFSIYCWTLGSGLSPHDVALKFEHRDIYDLLMAHSSRRTRLMHVILMADERAARAVLDEDPSLMASLTPEEHGHLAHAIFHGHFDAADLMIRLGFDPAAPGVDGGTALHAACWVGNVRMVERLLARGGVPLDARDPTHGSTPLGWAAYGSVHRRAAGADYAAVAERLVAAGADIAVLGNRAGLSLLTMAHGNDALQAVLRRLGAA
jgi:ankyrin repeat protein